MKDKKQHIVVDSKDKAAKKGAGELADLLQENAEIKEQLKKEGRDEERKDKLVERYGGEIPEQEKPIKHSDKEWDLDPNKEYVTIDGTPIEVGELEEQQKWKFYEYLLSKFLKGDEFADQEFQNSPSGKLYVPMVDSKASSGDPYTDYIALYGDFKGYLHKCVETLEWRINEDLPNDVSIGQVPQKDATDMIEFLNLAIDWCNDFLLNYEKYKAILNERAEAILKSSGEVV